LQILCDHDFPAMTLFSVIIPAYNQAEFIGETIQSVLNQSYSNFEIIIVNDGSTDDSNIICNKYLAMDNRIQVINQRHQGVSAARNRGLEAASCSLVSFVDSDDYVHPDYIKNLYELIVRYNADITVCDSFIIRGYSHAIEVRGEKTIVELTSNDALKMLLEEREKHIVTCWNKIYRKELFSGLNYPEGKIHEDEFITYKLLHRAKRIILLDQKLYYYCIRDGSIMQQDYSFKRLDMLDAFEERALYFKRYEFENFYIRSAYKYLAAIASHYDKIANSSISEEEVLKALKQRFIRFLKINDITYSLFI